MTAYRIVFALDYKPFTIYVDAKNRLDARAKAWDEARKITGKDFSRVVMRETWLLGASRKPKESNHGK